MIECTTLEWRRRATPAECASSPRAWEEEQEEEQEAQTEAKVSVMVVEEVAVAVATVPVPVGAAVVARCHRW